MATASGWVRRDGDDLVLLVRVQPRANRNEVVDVRDGRLRLRTTAPPADDKANQAVVNLLASYLHIAPSRISLLRGKTQRDKQLRVSGIATLSPGIAPDRVVNGL